MIALSLVFVAPLLSLVSHASADDPRPSTTIRAPRAPRATNKRAPTRLGSARPARTVEAAAPARLNQTDREVLALTEVRRFLLGSRADAPEGVPPAVGAAPAAATVPVPASPARTGWVPQNQTVDLRIGMIEPDERENPVTGRGSISVFATQRLIGRPSVFARGRQLLNRFRKQRFVVTVNEDGEAAIRAFRSEVFTQRLLRGATANAVRDVLRSSKIRENIVTMMGALFAASTDHGIVASAAATRWVQIVVDSVAEHRQARAVAIGETVEWAKQEVSDPARNGQYPTLTEAYTHYRGAVQRTAPGARAAEIDEFETEFRSAW